MKSSATFEYARAFGVKPLGNGCRFGIKVSSKKQDGSYTKGVFINCKYKGQIEQGKDYTLKGFFGDNEYNGNNTLEFIVMEAIIQGGTQNQPRGGAIPTTVENTTKGYQPDFPDMEDMEEPMPF